MSRAGHLQCWVVRNWETSLFWSNLIRFLGNDFSAKVDREKGHSTDQGSQMSIKKWIIRLNKLIFYGIGWSLVYWSIDSIEGENSKLWKEHCPSNRSTFFMRIWKQDHANFIKKHTLNQLKNSATLFFFCYYLLQAAFPKQGIFTFQWNRP